MSKSKKPHAPSGPRRRADTYASDPESAPTSLRDKRKALGMAVYDAASKAGLSPRVVLRLEAGEDLMADSLLALAPVYGMEPSAMFAEWAAIAASRFNASRGVGGGA